MAELLKGKPVADCITEETAKKAAWLRERGVEPALAIIRVGENPSDLSYEKGALKRAESAGITVKQFIFDENAGQEEIMDEIIRINGDDSIHGVLIFRPLPGHIDEAAVCEALEPAKDVDGITSGSMAGVFTDSGKGYPPCTAAACMEILEHYGYDLTGSKVTVMGRSLVIGKPVAMMAMKRNATVTICHSRTGKDDFREAGRNADVVIAALGRARMVTEEMLGRDQVIIDVGINVDDEGRLCGDVDFDGKNPEEGLGAAAAAVTPVPGGVGSVTTAVLMKHVAEAAEKSWGKA